MRCAYPGMAWRLPVAPVSKAIAPRPIGAVASIRARIDIGPRNHVGAIGIDRGAPAHPSPAAAPRAAAPDPAAAVLNLIDQTVAGHQRRARRDGYRIRALGIREATGQHDRRGAYFQKATHGRTPLTLLRSP